MKLTEFFHDGDLPEGPFEYQTTAREGDHHGKGHVYIIDRTGRKIASLWGKPQEKMAMAQFIIDASERLAMERAVVA
jgi:hypothetical protein